jgi:hypothetical protein
MKQQGRIRYTKSRMSPSLSEIELMRSQKFIPADQLFADEMKPRNAFPLAQERGVAVIAARHLIRRRSAKGLKPLPDWAAEFDCRSWAQFLKWFGKSVTCAIPATDKPRRRKINAGEWPVTRSKIAPSDANGLVVVGYGPRIRASQIKKFCV